MAKGHEPGHIDRLGRIWARAWPDQLASPHQNGQIWIKAEYADKARSFGWDIDVVGSQVDLVIASKPIPVMPEING